MNNSPDYKLRSIEIDDELTGRRVKKLVNLGDTDSNENIPLDDNSGTGHRVNSTKAQLASAAGLINKMKGLFLNFKS